MILWSAVLSSGLAEGEALNPLAIDVAQYDALKGATARGSLLRDGVFDTRGLRAINHVRWEASFEGSFIREPVVCEGRVLIGCNKACFFSVDLETGKEQWRVKVPGGVASSSCVSDGRVYFGSREGRLYAVRLEDGTVDWTYQASRGDTTSIRWTPAVAYGIVFFNDGTGIVGLDDVGRLVYRSKPGFALPDHAELTVLPGGILTATRWGGGMNCLSPATGELVWRSEGGMYRSLTSVATDGRVAIGTGSGRPDAPERFSALKAVAIADGKELWRTELEGHLPEKDRREVHTSPALWKNKIYVGSDSSYLYVLDAGNGRMLWKFKADGRIRSAPAISANDRTVVFGSEDSHVYGVDADSGELLWRQAVEGPVYAAPALRDGLVLVATAHGRLVALDRSNEPRVKR